MIYIEIFNKFIEVSSWYRTIYVVKQLECDVVLRVARTQQVSSTHFSSDTTVLYKLFQPIITHQLLEVDSNWPRGRGAVCTVFSGSVTDRDVGQIGFCSASEQ